MDEGGQTVTPAVTPGADLSMLHGQMLIQLQLQLDIATDQEDYKEAARLRDMIKALECEDPVLRLKIMMEKAIAEEQYADAARYRDELNRLAPQKDHTGLKCFSDITTEGIRVRVRSVYVRDRSQPCKQQYFFAYRIRISNEGFRSVQLLSRHWIITDAAGKIEHVR
jgi:ApaG protein